jgi:hypothetical protein
MRKSLLMSVSAIALIASAGIVTAQDKGGMSGGGAAQAPQNTSPAQQSAPSAQPGGEMRGGAETKGGQAEQQMDNKKGDRGQRAQDQRQPDQKGAQDQRQNQRENRAQEKSDNKGAADTKFRRDSTTGQGAAGSSGSASLTTEQRTKISTTIRQTNVRPVTNVNFNVSVGTVVPRGVTLHALPATVVEVYPEWRPYRFILVGDEIVIIEPDTLRIIAVIDA